MSGQPRIKFTQISSSGATQPWVYPLLLTSLLAVTAVVTVFVFLGLQVQRNKQVSASNAQLRAEITQLENNVSSAGQTATTTFASLQSQIDILRSQQAEMQMDSGNITILQSGTFIWGFAKGVLGEPSGACTWMWVNWQITTPGVGYVVGQLITLVDCTIPAFIQSAPVFRVATVDGSGAVLTLTTLSPGCARVQYLTPQGPFNSLSVNGTGLTLTAASSTGALPVDNSYYNYPTPPSINVGALQESQYYLKELSINGVAFTILQLNSPSYLIDLSAPSGCATDSSMLMTVYGFDPPVLSLQSLGEYNYLFPLTQRNLNAIDLADTTHCYTNGICFFSPRYTSTNDVPNSISFNLVYHYGISNLDDHFYPWIGWYWSSIDAAFDYLQAGMSFSLVQPLMLVLPSI